MPENRSLFLMWFGILALGIILRLPDLRHRPMHTDEAVHAVKFGALLETGTYAYDASEYHGPTLNFFTLIPAWIRGQTAFAGLDETTLRVVPAFFGLLLILILLLFVPFIGHRAALAAALWIAVSPVQVFYSRYYIQEVLYVFFSLLLLASILHYRQKRHWGWAVAAGAALGLLHATKETDILILAALAGAGISVWLDARRRRQDPIRPSLQHAAIFFLAALLLSGLFFSSFFAQPAGWIDSFRTYQTYFYRGAGETPHIHPWYYYFRLLFFFHLPGKPVWSEAWILPFAFLGAVRAFRRPVQKEAVKAAGFKRFIVFYTVILSAMYAAIPYKTPWNVLGFYSGLLVLAGSGSIEIVYLLKRKYFAGVALLVVCLFFLIRQSVLLNTTYDCDPCNPWVYAHPGHDVGRVSEVVERAARAGTGGIRTPVEVVVPRHEYWPLPWTLRRLENVGWYEKVDDSAPVGEIILVAPEEESALLRKLYELPAPGSKHLYVRLWQDHADLRPGVEIRGYIRQDRLDALPVGFETFQQKAKSN